MAEAGAAGRAADALGDAVLALLRDLVARRSVSPRDAGCQAVLTARLGAAGFDVTPLRFGAVDNFWATHRGAGAPGPTLVFAGHTDVVPSGPEAAWRSPPFTPTIAGEHLYGRGAADMKSSLAAMVCAAERYARAHPRHRGVLAFLVTSDEEGEAVDGTARVMEALSQRGERIDYCVVGEPSSSATLGDVIRIGRRGSLSGAATVRGVQGHVAYPAHADNPIHRAAAVLDALARRRWDEGDDDFPATTFQVSNIQAGTGAHNVIPGQLECAFNFRFSPRWTPAGLKAQVRAAFAAHAADCDIAWRLSGLPFITRGGALVAAVTAAIAEITGGATATSTSGGTSDGRFIAPTGAQVVEFGPVNETIHKVNERVHIADLGPLARVYERIAERLLPD